MPGILSHRTAWSFAVIVMVAGLVASCGDDGDEGAGSTSTTSGTPSESVVVERDIAYATAPAEGWRPAVLDVYAPAEAEDLPLVVLLHGGPGPADKNVLDYPELARAIAGQGAVVVVANWGGTELPHEKLAAGLTAAQIIEAVRLTNEEVACAVSFAVTYAEEYGADPTRLVLFGHSGGANEAGKAAWTESSPFAGCAVPPAEWTVKGLMLWEGDWFLGPSPNDAFGTDLSALLAVVSPWQAIVTATDVPPIKVEFAVSTTARDAMRHPDASSTAEWVAWRDPTGEMQSELEAVGAFADGFLDIGEPSEVMVNVLNARGGDATLLELTDPATTHAQLAEADFDVMVEHVLALAGT
jgi:pimeloyl-ACP methyl ester carboxylesterase